jgi:hypothetical protein
MRQKRALTGQRIEIIYRWATDSQIEVIGVELNPQGSERLRVSGLAYKAA